jgi:hypothetical protein
LYVAFEMDTASAPPKTATETAAGADVGAKMLFTV